MPYIYNDEDNNPMNDDPFVGAHNPTVYSSRAEMEYVESGQWDRDREEAEEARRQKQEDALDGLAMVIGLSEKCRECPYFYETAEGFLYKNHQISVEQMDYLKHLCAGCKGKETGEPDQATEQRLYKEVVDLREWMHGLGLKGWKCENCPNVYRVYCKYKDPDDEWKAIDDLCCNCKYFGEV